MHTHNSVANDITGEFHQTFKEEIINSSKNGRRENMSHIIP